MRKIDEAMTALRAATKAEAVLTADPAGLDRVIDLGVVDGSVSALGDGEIAAPVVGVMLHATSDMAFGAPSPSRSRCASGWDGPSWWRKSTTNAGWCSGDDEIARPELAAGGDLRDCFQARAWKGNGVDHAGGHGPGDRRRPDVLHTHTPKAGVLGRVLGRMVRSGGRSTGCSTG